MPLTYIIKDKYLRIGSMMSAGILLMSGILAYYYFGESTMPFVIHFDAYENVDFLGDREKIAGVIATGFVILATNLILANILYMRERLLSYMLVWGGFGVAVLILSALFAIIGVN